MELYDILHASKVSSWVLPARYNDTPTQELVMRANGTNKYDRDRDRVWVGLG